MASPLKINLDESQDSRSAHSQEPIQGNFSLTQESNGGLLDERISAIEDGSYSSPPIPAFPILSSMMPLLPGSMTALCGAAKASKSFLVAEWLWRLLLQPSDVIASMLTLEEDPIFHHWRVFAQLAEDSRLTRVPWMVENKDTVRELRAKCKEATDYVGLGIHKMTRTETAENVIAWARREATQALHRGGRPARVLIIDPISFLAADQGNYGQANNNHTRAVMGLKDVALKTGCAIILVTHPVKSPTRGPIEASMSNYSNGQIYGRACSLLLWLEGMRKSKECTIAARAQAPTQTVSYNRTLKILGARNADNVAPQGIAMHFNGGNLWHSEQGIITDE
jgi:hypothetical protein